MRYDVCFSSTSILMLISEVNAFSHCHYFQEVVELCEGDEISVAECAFGGEGERSWRDNLHLENRYVEFDTRIGHLSFVVLHSERDGNAR